MKEMLWWWRQWWFTRGFQMPDGKCLWIDKSMAVPPTQQQLRHSMACCWLHCSAGTRAEPLAESQSALERLARCQQCHHLLDGTVLFTTNVTNLALWGYRCNRLSNILQLCTNRYTMISMLVGLCLQTMKKHRVDFDHLKHSKATKMK